MNWEAISAIGQILGILITFMVGCIAMLPYMRKFNIYFSFMYNVDKKPTFVVTNNSQKGQFINRIILYSGKWSRKSFCAHHNPAVLQRERRSSPGSARSCGDACEGILRSGGVPSL